MKKPQGLIIAIIVAVIVITVGAFLVKKPVSQSNTAFLEKYGLNGLSVEEIVQKLDSSISDASGLRASITSDYLILSDASDEVRVALPKDKFYLSFAPYIDQSHDCYFHSLTTCTAELGNKKFDVTVTDAATGETIVDETLTSFDNGFIGLWLPKGIEAELSVQYEGKSASAGISTISDDDATCLTTLQLS